MKGREREKKKATRKKTLKTKGFHKERETNQKIRSTRRNFHHN